MSSEPEKPKKTFMNHFYYKGRSLCGIATLDQASFNNEGRNCPVCKKRLDKLVEMVFPNGMIWPEGYGPDGTKEKEKH